MSDVFFTEEQQALKRKYRALVAEHVIPRAREIDEKDRVPKDLLRKLTVEPFHLSALSVPKRLGGLGLSQVETGIVAEEVGYGSPALIPLLEIAQLYSHVLLIGGTEDQQKRFLGQLVAGTIGCYALTDEGPGSDPAHMRSVARAEGDGFRLDGRKRLITFADLGNLYAVFANEAPEQGAKGVSAFIVEKGAPGLTLERHVPYLGLLGHRAYDIALNGVYVPRNNRIGGQGEGLKLALSVLNRTRISLAWGYVGLARAALEAAVKFAQERVIDGQPLAQQQAVRFALAEIATQIDAARLLAYRAAVMADQNLSHRKATSMAKLAGGEALIKAVDLAFRIHAGYGGDKAYPVPVERYLRDAYSWISAQGTPEVQKLVIAREILRLHPGSGDTQPVLSACGERTQDP
ncbi:MAG: acyl-CoA dehydrogenase family protein [Candidatus Binatia bacterium]